MRQRRRNQPGMKREKGIEEEEEGERKRAGEKTKLPVDASVGMRKQTNTGGNECFMEPPGCFLPGWKATIRESARQRCVCLCVARREEKGEGRRNND